MLARGGGAWQSAGMTDAKSPDQPAPLPDPRKERLAAQLRANLRRRKAQGREMAEGRESEEN
jgi:hypothetical protein